MEEKALTNEDILNRCGWTITCHSPLEVTHEDGSYAIGLAAQYCIDGVVADYKAEENIK